MRQSRKRSLYTPTKSILACPLGSARERRRGVHLQSIPIVLIEFAFVFAPVGVVRFTTHCHSVQKVAMPNHGNCPFGPGDEVELVGLKTTVLNGRRGRVAPNGGE